MVRFSQFLFTIFLLPALAIAQTNFQPAVTVNLKGDTLRGYIDYHEWENNPGSISFKTGMADAPVTLTAKDIRYFNVSVGHLAAYIAYHGPISTDNTNTAINHLTVGRDTGFKQETVFLKVIEEGKNLVLLSYTDALKNRFFMAENLDARPVELTYRVYWNSAEENGTDRTTYETAFKGQLYDAGTRSGVMTTALKNQIKKAGYNEEDLVNIASTINGISAADPTKNNPTKTKGVFKTVAIVGGILVAIWVVADFIHINSNHR
jgi:hypothetical protein